MRNRFYAYWYSYLPMLDADAGNGGSGDAGQGNDSNSGGDSSQAGDGDGVRGGDKPSGKTFTQDELDKIIAKRIARERKDWDAKVEEEKRKAAMTEAERLKAEKDEAEKAASERVSAANKRVIRAEASVQAAQLGIKPERIKHALKLADLSAIEVGDDGEPDGKAIKSALEAVLKEMPELKGASDAASRSGGTFNGNSGNGNADMNALIRRAAGR